MDELIRKVLVEIVRLCEPTIRHDYEEYVALTELREELLIKVNKNKPLNDSQIQLLNEINKYDSMIIQQMLNLKIEAEEGLRRLNASKKQKIAYVNDETALDSFMYDKRK